MMTINLSNSDENELQKLFKSDLVLHWSLMCKVIMVQVNKVQSDSGIDFVRGKCISHTYERSRCYSKRRKELEYRVRGEEEEEVPQYSARAEHFRT